MKKKGAVCAWKYKERLFKTEWDRLSFIKKEIRDGMRSDFITSVVRSLGSCHGWNYSDEMREERACRRIAEAIFRNPNIIYNNLPREDTLEGRAAMLIKKHS